MVLVPPVPPIEGLLVRLTRSRLLAAAAVPLVLLASACGSGDDKGSAPNPLDSVTVAGAAKSPALTLKTKPFSVTKTESKVLNEGKGAVLSSGNSIGANYVLVNGKDGKQVESSFGKTVAAMDLDAKLLPGLRKGLLGKKVGSRVLVAVPPADAFGTAGNTQIGVGGTDTVLFLVDVISAKTPLTMAQGTAVPPKAGLPTVAMGKSLVGKTIGSRVLLVVPPKDGYGSAGQAQAKISGTDTLVFVVDLLDAT